MVEGFGMEDFFCVFQSLRDNRILEWKFEVTEGELIRLVDERAVDEDSTRVSRHASPAISSDILVAHGVMERCERTKRFRVESRG